MLLLLGERMEVLMFAKYSAQGERDIAQKRVDDGRLLLDVQRPNWHKIMHRFMGAVVMADPDKCFLAVLETAVAASLDPDIYIGNRLPAVLRGKCAISFSLACTRIGLITYDDAVACGFAKSKDDPPTLYGALHDCWVHAVA